MCAAQHRKRYYDAEDLCQEEWELNDEEIAALDLQGAASPMQVEGDLPDRNAEEMTNEGFYMVKSVLRHSYRQGWRFLTRWEGFGVKEATWEPFSAFVLPEGRLNSVLVDYVSRTTLMSCLGSLRRLPPRLKLQTEPYPYLPKSMCGCAIPKVLRAGRRNGVLIIPKSARLLNPADVLPVPRGTPRVSRPLSAHFFCWRKHFGE